MSDKSIQTRVHENAVDRNKLGKHWQNGFAVGQTQ